MTLLVTPLMIATTPYEYNGIVDLPKNDTLAWLDELENERDQIDLGPVCVSIER